MIKQFRLWINASGAPLYVECSDGELTQDTFREVSAIVKEAFAGKKPIVLGPDWEIRVLTA